MARAAAPEYIIDTNQGRTLLDNIVIAVVDDDESVREALTGFVRSLGYSAVAFPSAAEFLNSKRRHGAACLITDVQMPGMTGPELHERLVACGEPIPTILITAYPSERVRSRVLQAGVKGYLTKPFAENDLLACIDSALHTHAAGERRT
jgi:FixJ family two-component response regulator